MVDLAHDIDPKPDIEGPSQRRHPIRWMAAALGLVIVVLIGVLATRTPTDQRAVESPLIGHAAPAVEGPTLDGKTFTLRSQLGHWVLVNFFATWCVPCRKEHPELKTFAERHQAARDATVVMVVFNDSTDAVRSWFDEHGGTWPVILGDEGDIALAYGVTAVPESYLVDPNGRVDAKLVGGVTDDELEKVLATALGKPS
jgi:cytochrome c biogenesis protein CcmG/thiol:disulfide interchange protein DsbE